MNVVVGGYDKYSREEVISFVNRIVRSSLSLFQWSGVFSRTDRKNWRGNPQYHDIKLNYLPISSLEKYIKKGLIDSFDQKLYEKLDNYLFQKDH